MNSSVPIPIVHLPKEDDKCEKCSHREICKMMENRIKLQEEIEERRQLPEYQEFDVYIKCKYYESRPYTILR